MRTNDDSSRISSYFDYGFDDQNRRLFLYGDIGEDTISVFIMGLMFLDKLSNKPIEIIMSSFGGCDYEMFGAYDAIKSCSSKTRAIAIGKIMSAAPLILAAADESLAYANTRFMIHESSEEIDGRAGTIRSVNKELEEVDKAWSRLMASNTNLTASAWAKMFKGKSEDCYFDAKKALEYGIIDSIIEVE